MKYLKRILLLAIIGAAFQWASSYDANVESKLEPISLEEITPTTGDIYLEKVSSVVSTGLAMHIVDGCERFSDWALCIKNIIGISSAESSIFVKVGTHNNGFGIMQRGKDGFSVKRFQSLEEGVDYFLSLYERNKRYKRNTADAWLKANYCASECKHWAKNYNGAIAKLGL